MSADAFSDLLKTVRLTGACFFEILARPPWVAESPPPGLILPKIRADAEQLIAYHIVAEGTGFAQLLGEEPIPIRTGDIVVFSHCDAHVLSSSPGVRADPFAASTLDRPGESLPIVLNLGGGGPADVKLVCGYLACDARPFNPLIGRLPKVIVDRAADGEDRGRLGQIVRFAIDESGERRAGGESVLAKLSELMFIEVVRRYYERLPPENAGWFAGLGDPFVGRALALLHGEPARAWTIEDLAREVGASRSVLAERFPALLGVPPMQYLAQWRMQMAAGLLASGANVATIASEVGYESEAAFSRAFKRMVGSSPSTWRNKSRPAGPD